MLFPIPMRRPAIVLAISLFALVGVVMPAPQQHVPVNTPRPGERRVNANIFKASHNAYDRSESLAEQLDDMNCWCLELDIHWVDDEFYVGHESCDTDKRLRDLLAIAEQSETWHDKVTVLWFQVNSRTSFFGDDCPLPSPDVYEAELQSSIHDIFNWSCVYTPADFHDVDNGEWPSWQEMVRRGKNLVIVTERNKHSSPHFPHPVKNWFFEVTDDKPAGIPGPGSALWDSNVVFYNDDEPGNFSFDKGNYWASRIWPGSSCGSEGEWNGDVNSGATLVATNCLSNPFTQASPVVHPPQPTFVTDAATGEAQYGTRRFPYRMAPGLVQAMQRTANYGTSTEIRISPGDYNITGANPPAGVMNPMLLKAPMGGVVIR